MAYWDFGNLERIKVWRRMNKKVFITESSRETQRIGKEFAKRLQLDKGVTLSKKGASVIALYGDLGSGKTTFVQGVAEGLGIKRRIISPTFIIVRTYKLEAKSFYHIDLYRIEGQKDIENLGIEEIVKDPRNIVVIEWAERMRGLLPRTRIDIGFFYENINKRRIEISPKE